MYNIYLFVELIKIPICIKILWYTYISGIYYLILRRIFFWLTSMRWWITIINVEKYRNNNILNQLKRVLLFLHSICWDLNHLYRVKPNSTPRASLPLSDCPRRSATNEFARSHLFRQWWNMFQCGWYYGS